ncbi:MAG: flagellar basal body rod C-terminal domain-containing protein [Desulfovibrio sp.]|jgi:flagellar basal-body rod protein FlgC
MVINASPSAQALSAFGTSLNATAHNVANVSTEGYQPQRVELADGPGGQGVQVAAVTTAQGSDAVPARVGEAPAEGAGLVNGPQGGLTASSVGGVDIVREMLGLMTTSRAFEANTVMVRAAEETTGHVLDLIV